MSSNKNTLLENKIDHALEMGEGLYEQIEKMLIRWEGMFSEDIQSLDIKEGEDQESLFELVGSFCNDFKKVIDQDEADFEKSLSQMGESEWKAMAQKLIESMSALPGNLMKPEDLEEIASSFEGFVALAQLNPENHSLSLGEIRLQCQKRAEEEILRQIRLKISNLFL